MSSYIPTISQPFIPSQQPRCISAYKLVLAARDVRDVHVVGGRGQILQLLAGEDVDGDHVDLGVTVLARLRGGHFHDLAWATLDDDVAVLPQGRTLHRERGRRTGVGALEGVLMLCRTILLAHVLLNVVPVWLYWAQVAVSSAHATPP